MAIEMERNYYELATKDDDACGDNISVKTYGGRVTIEIEEPWAGDSYSGFGVSAEMRMSADDFIKWAEAAIAHVKGARGE